MMKVLVRADAANHIGQGHVMRCLSLAKALKRLGHDVVFLTKIFDSPTDQTLDDLGFEVVVIDAPAKADKSADQSGYQQWLLETQLQDFDRAKSALGDSHFDWIVIDNYAIDEQWEQRARAFTDRILVVDDLADRRHDCDVLLDQNIATQVQTRYFKLTPKGATLLIGTRFCLLGPEFDLVVKKPIENQGKLSLLIFFGGSDVGNLTQSTLTTLTKTGLVDDYNVSVLVGPLNRQFNEIADYCSAHNLVFNTDIKNMAEYLSRFDFAIAACGFICYELAAMVIPSLLVPVSDIQSEVAHALSHKGVANVISPEQLEQGDTLMSELKKLSEIDVDNFADFPKTGAINVAKNMQEFI